MVWLGTGKGKESDKGSDLFPGPRAEEDFKKQGLFCFLEEMKEKEWPRVQNWRSKGATVDLDLGSKKFAFAV